MKDVSLLLCFKKTAPNPCGYLKDRQAIFRFASIPFNNRSNEIDILYRLGYRRNGMYMYTPVCTSCSECIPIRIMCSDFKFSTSQKRCWKKNSHLTVQAVPPHFTLEYYTLYARYIKSRHSEGDMFPPTEEQFTSFLCEKMAQSIFVEFRDSVNTLIAVTVIDCLDNGLAPIYTFFEPTAIYHSLGTYTLLWLIHFARFVQLDYLYLGYWIRKCHKMSYKNQFKPYELFQNGVWQKI